MTGGFLFTILSKPYLTYYLFIINNQSQQRLNAKTAYIIKVGYFCRQICTIGCVFGANRQIIMSKYINNNFLSENY